ncbi:MULTISPECIES: DUF4307 domain-containing protein [unclassified Nocardioides]|uniref:DUF4307 domain-containing protein n=1 Tax=unclassified Nocardioides TaxID=2615069 RepID=UPI00115278A1|nr:MULTISPECIES: DUF4307 domain-containing protein [unclassified Nocardioides]TQK69873.1 uncharacterized protein DUF4307 [Nocardioides sp. SLBN-35]WGY00891.1 DUF4307 domain-containing protein [Nocardioides sp. QY071]
MSTSPDDPGTLAQRYGAPSRGRRTAVVVGAGAVVVVFLGWLLWAMLFHANPAVSSEEIGHEVVDDHTATIRVRVTYGDGPVDATCVARAISHDKAVVGEQSFTPGRDDEAVQEVTVRTERRATTVEWIGCKTSGQTRYR